MLLIGQIGVRLRSVLLALERACGWLDGGDLSTSLEMTESIGLCSGRQVRGLRYDRTTSFGCFFVIIGLTCIVIPGLTGDLVRDDADWFAGDARSGRA